MAIGGAAAVNTIVDVVRSKTEGSHLEAGMRSFDPQTDIVDNTIVFAQGQRFATGDPVIYRHSGSDAIGLVDGTVYYVIRVDGKTIQLAATAGGSALTLTPPAEPATAQHSLQKPAKSVEFSDFTVDAVNDRINFGQAHGLSQGEAFVYFNAADGIAGLQNGRTYYAIRIDANAISPALSAEDAANHKAMDIAVATHLPSLEVRRSLSFDPTAQANGQDTSFVGNNILHFANPHQLSSGHEVVYYNAENQNLGGLETGKTYYVTVVDAYSVKLSQSAEDQASQVYLDLAPLAADAVTLDHALSVTEQLVIDQTAVDEQADTIRFAADHHLQTNDVVVYRSDGNRRLAGLRDNATYYVIKVDSRTIQLAATSNQTSGSAKQAVDLSIVPVSETILLESPAGNIGLAANNASVIGGIAVAGGGAQGVAGSLSVVVNTMVDTIEAVAADSDLHAAKDILLTTRDAAVIAGAAGAVNGAQGVAVGGALSVDTMVGKSSARVEAGSALFAGRDIRLHASNVSVIGNLSVAGGGAQGVAVGISGSVNTLVTDTEAQVIDSTAEALQDVKLAARNTSVVGNAAGSVNGAQGGAVSAAVSVNTVVDRVTAKASGSDIDAGRDLALTGENCSVIGNVAVGGSGAQFFAAGGSVVVNTIANTTEAEVIGTATKTPTLDAGRDILLKASDTSVVGAIAGAIQFTITGATVGGAVAVNTIDNRIRTRVEKATLTAAHDIVLNSVNHGVIGNIAFSGTVGIFAAGGTVAVNTLSNETGSRVTGGSTLEAGNDIVLESRDTSVIGVVAGAFQVGGLSFGASVSVNTIDNGVASFASDSSLTAGHDVKLVSRSTAVIGNVAFSNAGGGIGLGGAFAVNTIGNSTESCLSGITLSNGDQSANVNAGGDILLTAADASVIGVVAYSQAGGGLVVGAAIAVNTIDNTVSAHVEGGNLSADGTIKVDADTTTVIGSITVGAPSGVVAGGASVVVNTVSNETKAYIANAPDVEADGDIVIEASDLSVIGALTGNIGISAIGALGASVSVNTIQNTVRAYVDKSILDTGGSVTVTASDRPIIGNVTVAGNAGLGIAAGAAVAVNTIGNTIEAEIRNNSIVIADGDVLVTAESSPVIGTMAGGLSLSVLASLGGAVAVNTIQSTITAEVNHSRITALTGSVEVIAKDVTGNHRPDDFLLQDLASDKRDKTELFLDKAADEGAEWEQANIISIAACVAASVGVGGCGAVSSNEIENTISAKLIDAEVTAEDISVEALSGAKVFSLAAGIGGALGLGLSSANSHIRVANTVTAAGEGSSVLQAADSMFVFAGDHSGIDTVGINVSGGVIGAVGNAYAGSDSLNAITASIGGSSEVQKAQSLAVRAENLQSISSLTVGVNIGGLAAVGGTESLAHVAGTTQAYIGDSEGGQIVEIGKKNGSTVANVDVQAVSDIAASTKSVAVAGGVGVGVGVNFSEVRIDPINKAFISDHADIKLSGDLLVRTDSRTIAGAETVGVTVAGGVSVGVSSAKAIVTPDMDAHIGGATIDVGGDLTVETLHDVSKGHTKALAHASGGGILVGVSGADADATVKPTINTYIGGPGLDLKVTGEAKIRNESTHDAQAYGIGVTVSGAVGWGAMTADAESGVVIHTYAQEGSKLSARKLTIESLVNDKAMADALAGGGALGLSVGTADATATGNSTVDSYLSHIDSVTVGSDLSVKATVTPQLKARAEGVNVAPGVAIGAKNATVKAEPKVTTYLSATGLRAGSLTISANQALPGNDYTGYSEAYAAGGSLLVGVNAATSTASNGAELASYLADGSSITVTGATLVSATNHFKQQAYGSGKTPFGGLVGVGAVNSDASYTVTTNAYLGEDVHLTGGSLTISAVGQSDSFAHGVAGSGGVIAGNASSAETTSNSTTTASINAGAGIDVDSLRVEADHTAKFNAVADSVTAALVGASGAHAENSVDSDVRVVMGADVDITAGDIDLQANNRILKDWIVDTYNATSGSGGALDLPAVSSETDIRNATVITVADGASLAVVNNRGEVGGFNLSTLNDITARDRTKLDSGGLISVPKAESKITNNDHSGQIVIGDADLNSVGDIDLSTLTGVEIDAQANAKSYGLAGAAQGHSEATATVDNDIIIDGGAAITAQGGVALMAGQNRAGEINHYAISARTDLWNKTALPINIAPSADGTLTQSNTVTIAENAWVGSAADVQLVAEMGEISVVGKGVGKDLYRQALEALTGALGGNVSLEIEGGNGGVQSGSADVIVEGTVEAGINNASVLLIGDPMASLPDSGIAGFDERTLHIDEGHAGVVIASTDGVTYTVEQGSDLLAAVDARIAKVTSIRDSYAGTNEYDDFDAQVAILQSIRNDLAMGNTAVNFINVGPLFASSGDIIIKGHRITGNGTGQMIAPSDTQVVIKNATPYYLRTDDITIPEYGGGFIRFNFRDLNQGELDSFSKVVSGSDHTTHPAITIENMVGDPGIEITGDISNLNGTIDVATEGNIYLWASADNLAEGISVTGDTVNFYAGGDFVQSSIPLLQNIGGQPNGSLDDQGQWVVGSWDTVANTAAAGKTDFTVHKVNGSAEVDGTLWNEVTIESQINHVDDSERGSLIAGNKVFVSARHLNVNGYIQSGFKDKSVLIPEAGTLEGDILHREIEGYERDYHQRVAAGEPDVNPCYLLDLGENAQNVGNVVYYNARDNRIEVRDITIQGGFIQLYGDIINTGTGILQVLDGYGRIKIENRSEYELLINNLNAGQEIEGKIKIIDTSGTSTRTTIYAMIGDHVEITHDNGTVTAGPAGQSTAAYQPLMGQRYNWVTGQAKKDIEIRKNWTNSLDLWLVKIDALIADSANWQKTSYYTDPIQLEKGAYYTLSTPDPSFVYRYDYSEVNLSAWSLVADSQLDDIENSLAGVDLKNVNPYQQDTTTWKWQDFGFWAWAPFVGTFWFPVWLYVPIHSSYAEVVMERSSKDVHTHTLAADNAIHIQFSGYDSARIDVLSTEDVTLQGSIKNKSGVTTLVSDGSIERGADSKSAIVNAVDLRLYAGTGIGHDNSILTRLDGGSVSAYTGSGDIAIQEILGDLTVKEIEIPHFDPFASPGEVFEFSPSRSVDATNYTIELAVAHGLATGDLVRYSSGGGSVISGLTSGNTYKALVVNSTTLMLAAAATDTSDLVAAQAALKRDGISAVNSLVLHIDAAGAMGDSHSLIRDDGQPDTVTAASVTSGIIDFGTAHGFKDGQAVVYSSSGPVIPGLVNGATYFVSVVDNTRIRVSGSRDSIISYLPDLIELDASAAGGFDHSFEPTKGGTHIAINPFALAPRSVLTPDVDAGGYVNHSADSIEFGFTHGLTTGKKVTYAVGVYAINGLVDGIDYYVIRGGDTWIKLATSEANALNGVAIDISRGAVTYDYAAEPKLLVEQSKEKASFTFDPATAIGGFLWTMRFEAAHPFTQNQAVVYRDSGDGDPISNLVSGNSYYVDVVDAWTIRLLDGVNGTAMAIGVPESLSSSYSLDFTEQLDVTLTDVSIDDMPFNPFAGLTDVAVDDHVATVTIAGQSNGTRLKGDVGSLYEGLEVVYHSGMNEAVGGLGSATTFVVERIGANTIRLRHQAGDPPIQYDFGTETEAVHGLRHDGQEIRIMVSEQSKYLVFDADHGFSDGDQVVYSKGGAGNAAVGGLEDGKTYLVSVLDERTVALAPDEDGFRTTAITFDFSVATGGSHSLTKGTDPADLFTATAQNGYLVFPKDASRPYNPAGGDVVTYDNNGWTPIGGLEDVTAYKVIHVAEKTLSLKHGNDGNAIALDFSAATGSNHRLGAFELDPAKQAMYLVFDAAHGLTGSETLTYHQAAGDRAVTGLVDGNRYSINKIDARTITLSETSGGAALELGFTQASLAGHTFSYDPGSGTVELTFDPTIQNRYISLNEEHGLSTEDTIDYDPGSSTAIGGLSSGSSYFVSALDSAAGTFEVTATVGGEAINLDFSQASGTTHRFSSRNVIQAQHQFRDGQQVVYHTLNRAGIVDSGNASVFGLTEGATYAVDKLSSSSFRLLDGHGAVVDFDLDPANIDQELQYKFSSKDEIALHDPTSLAVGEAVRYVSGSHTSLDGLVDGNTYYVVSVTDSTVSLSGTKGGAAVHVDLVTELAPAGTDDDHLITDFHLLSLNKLDLGVEHGFEDLDRLVYDSGTTDIGLVAGETYTVKKVNGTTIKLLDGSGDLVEFDPANVSNSTHSFSFLSQNDIDPATAISDKQLTITLGTAHELRDGDLVTYHKGTDAHAIGGLVDGGSYYVDVFNPTTVRLARSLDELGAGDFIELDTSGVTTADHRLGVVETLGLKRAEDVISGDTMDVGYAHGLITGDRVVYHSGSGDAIGGLIDGETYYVVVVGPGSFKLAADLDDILVANPDVIALGESNAGVHSFTRTESASGALGDVELVAAGSIVNFDENSVIRGGMVSLTSGKFIGTATSALQIDTASSSASGLTGFANRDIFIREISDSLNLLELESQTGDVEVTVDSGALRDSNREEQIDERAVDELMSLWNAMNLTGEAAEEAANETIDSYLAMRGREYQSYWSYRNRQDDPSQYDPDFEIGFNDQERAGYEEHYRDLGLRQGMTGAELDQFVADGIATLESKRTDEYHELHRRYGVLGDVEIVNWSYESSSAFEPDVDPAADVDDASDSIAMGPHIFSTGQGVKYHTGGGAPLSGLENDTIYYVVVVDSSTIQLARTEADALAATPVIIDIASVGSSGIHRFSETEAIRDGSVWTEAQLRYSLGGGWLKKTADTTTRIEGANVTGRDVVLEAQAIGANMEEVVIDLRGGLFELSDNQKVALMAAERDSMVLIDGPRDTITLGRPHELATGDAVVLPGSWKLHSVDGVIAGKTYYAVAADAFSFQLADSYDAAVHGAPVVDILTHESRIVSQEDLDIAASGTLTATTGDFAYLGSEQDMHIAAIEAGGAVRIKVDGSIKDATDTESANIKAGALLLEAAGGSIGGSGEPADLDVTLDAGGLFTGRAEDSVYLTSIGADLSIDTIFAEQSVTLRTEQGGSLLDGYNTDNGNIDTVHLYLYSDADIGSAANRLDLDQDAAGRLTVEAVGHIYLSELTGDMNIAQVASTAGDVDLIAAISILGRPGDFLADVIGNSISLRAVDGSIGAPAGEDLNFDSSKWATGSLTSLSRFNAYLHEIEGDLTLYQTGSTLGTVFVDSPGRILNGNPVGDNVVSGATRLYASSNVGAADHPLKTSVGTLQGYSQSGSVWIENTGPLSINVVGSGDYGIEAKGPIEVITHSPLTVDYVIRSDDDIVLVAGDKAEDGDDLTLAGSAALESKGTVILRAGDNLLIEPGATVQAASTVELSCDYGNADPGAGGSIVPQGQILADSVEVFGEADDDVFDLRSLTLPATVSGGAGSDTLISPDRDHTWEITGPNSGSMDGTFIFEAVENLTSGSGDDTFYFLGAGRVDGVIDGGAGFDVLDFLQSDFIREAAQNYVDVELPIGDQVVPFAATGGIVRIEEILAYRWGEVQEDGTLILNMGPRAAERLTINTEDGDETFTLSHVAGYPESVDGETISVTAFGFTLEYGGVRAILGSGALGNDSVILGADVMAPATLDGGPGDDWLVGGAGADVLIGGSGNDTLEGAAGDDVMDGGWDNDRYVLVPGSLDKVIDARGVDTLDFSKALLGLRVDLNKAWGQIQKIDSAGNKLRLCGMIENAVGSEFNDLIYGNRLNNTLEGLGGDDRLYGDHGNDLLAGGAGDDRIEGGCGDDLLFFPGALTGVTVKLTWGGNGWSTDGLGGTDTLRSSIDGAIGTPFDDILIGDDSRTEFHGGAGDDFIDGRGGDDRLYGGEGEDIIFAGWGNDLVGWSEGEGHDTIDMGDGWDKIRVTTGEDDDHVSVTSPAKNKVSIQGTGSPDWVLTVTEGDLFEVNTGGGDDVVVVGNLNCTDVNEVVLYLGEGDDRVEGAGATKTIRAYGEAGNDRFIGGSGKDTFDGGEGSDWVDYSGAQKRVHVDLTWGASQDGRGSKDYLKRIENVIGTAFDDMIWGTDGANEIQALGGDDKVWARRGDDVVDGGEGHDMLWGDDGDDILIGGAGNDLLWGGRGDDQIYGGAGDDNLYGDSGEDELFGDDGDDLLVGGRGEDTLDGGAGKNKLIDWTCKSHKSDPCHHGKIHPCSSWVKPFVCDLKTSHANSGIKIVLAPPWDHGKKGCRR